MAHSHSLLEQGHSEYEHQNLRRNILVQQVILRMSQEEDKSENNDFKTLKLFWNCTLCTFENKSESFKCKMCHVRRGSSSRQSSINHLLVTQQFRQTSLQNQKKQLMNKHKEPFKCKKKNLHKVGRSGILNKQLQAAKITNIDRKSGESLAITVNNVTVTFTEYKLKPVMTKHKKISKKVLDFIPQCLVPSEIDCCSRSSFTSQSESIQSYTETMPNDKIESSSVDQ